MRVIKIKPAEKERLFDVWIGNKTWKNKNLEEVLQLVQKSVLLSDMTMTFDILASNAGWFKISNNYYFNNNGCLFKKHKQGYGYEYIEPDGNVIFFRYKKDFARFLNELIEGEKNGN